MYLKQLLKKLAQAAVLLPLMFVLTDGQLMSSAFAEEEKDVRKYADVKTKKRQSVGRKCAKKLESAQKVIGGDVDPSKAQLNQLTKDLRGYIDTSCKSSYEKSQVWNLRGYAYYSLDRYPDAITSYKKMLAEPEVDERQKVSTRYTVAQLYLMQEDYRNAAEQLELWMKETTLVTAEGKVLLAQAYYQLNRKADALKLVNGVINDAENKGITPKEGWWSLQRVLYYERKDYKTVVSILKKLVTHYPRVSYWKQLGGMYAELEQEMNHLVTADLVYLQKGADKENQLIGLAYLYLGAGVPYRAARIIEDGMKAGIIEETGKNLELLGNAWQSAADTKRAAPVLERAAKMSDKGNVWARLAGVYLDGDQNAKAVQAARKALQKGDLKRPEMTQMTLGSALINLHCYNDAVQSFKKAKKVKTSEKAAGQWIRYASGEGQRRQQLIDSGAKGLASCKKV